MGTFSIWHWLIVLAIAVILFGGRGKISQLMGDFGKGLKNFKKNIKDDDKEKADPTEAKTIDGTATEISEDKESSEKASKE
ncbi:MAG TPA: twin-arginine translocase TatA/TatE family subunit [Rhodospirillaceae bacterium]|nr:twin-arginine translocase TatA/TatE family subunit [Rhodospirillaceae bacterium]HAT34548.1 twin-arginine translocase TatA/TatE family subunit [Rhodospirillaceae bacterium]